MTAAQDWKKQRTIARLKGKSLVAIVSDGYDSSVTMYVDEPWQAFAIAWWNKHVGLSASVMIVAAAYVLPREAILWFEGGLNDSGWVREDDDGWRPWSAETLSAGGFVEGVDYRIGEGDDDVRVSSHDGPFVELTRAGKDKALEYAREQIEQECAAENKPLPWEVV